MIAHVKCGRCSSITKLEVSYPLEVILDDTEEPEAPLCISETLECVGCGKEYHVNVTVELFED